MNFKNWLQHEEVKTKPLDYPYDRKVITLGLPRPEKAEDEHEISGFCLHNHQINAFAQKNATQMFIVFAFVFYTIQKEWQIVRQSFPEFIKWVFEEAIIKEKKGIANPWYYGEQPFRKYANLIGAKKGNAHNALYLAQLWPKREKVYRDIMTYLGRSNNTALSDPSEYLIFKYINDNINGLAAVKAAFATQLIVGKYGCIDSINMRAYDKMIRSDIESKGKQSGFAVVKRKSKAEKNELGKYANITDDKGNVITDLTVKKSQVGLKGYVQFLHYLEDLYQDNISKILWDDWCKIVNDKIVRSNDKGDKNEIILNVNNQNFVYNPYKVKSNTREMMAKEKEFIKKHDPSQTGSAVSLGHLQAIKSGEEYGDYKEEFNSALVVENIRKIRNYLSSLC